MSDDVNSPIFAHHQRFPQMSLDEPRPPFVVDLVDYLLVGVAFDRAAVRDLVPLALDLPPRVHGFIGTGHASYGWGITPFSNFYLALAVDGIMSPDGTPALFRPLNIYSDRAGRIFRKYYNALIKLGSHSFSQEDEVRRVDVAAEDGLAVRLAVRQLPGEEATFTTGIHHYLGQDARGEVTSFHVSYSAHSTAATVVDFEISGGDRRFHLQPELTWASQLQHMAITIGEPRGSPFAPDDPTPRASSLTALLGRIGLPAACVARDGRLMSRNPAARSLLESVVPGGQVIARRAGGQLSLDPAALSALGQVGQTVALLLERREGGLPIVAQAFAIGRDLVEEDALLVLFRDPAGRDAVDPATVLELLGLTPAEARLAVAMGAGNSVARAAESLGITANTARSTLKAVFGKLQIGRQSELARIVARISLGAD